VSDHALAFGRLACALDLYLVPGREVAIVGDPQSAATQALLDVVNGGYRPHLTLALARADADAAAQTIPLLQDRPMLDGKATAYVCQNFTCQLPTTEPAELARQLGD